MDLNKSIHWLDSEWPLPQGVKALVTTRHGGFSLAPYDSFNLALHVGDDPTTVVKNRNFLRKVAHLPNEPIWLNQVHGVEVWNNLIEPKSPPVADASVSDQSGQVLVIMTADCLPILFSDDRGRAIGAAHAGWRGLCQGVIEKTVQQIIRVVRPDDELKYKNELLVWLGPAIGPTNFEVGEEVKQAFLRQAELSGQDSPDSFFTQTQQPNKYRADLYGLARMRLKNLGIDRIYGASHCVYEDQANYFSYRREKITGRFASLIWKE